MAKIKTMNGIDISKWQKGLDLSKINCDFVIIKATEGIGYVDPCCDAFFQEAKKLGKKLGFYHFARPMEDVDPIVEAQFFYNNTKNYFGEAIPVLDWESDKKHDVAWAKAWLDEIYRLSGVKPMIYMSEYVVNAYDWSSVANADYGLWVAKYKDMDPDYNYDMTNSGKKPSVKWWSIIAMWQWTSSGRLDGYDGNIDCDLFYGDAKAWDAYVGQASEQTSEQTSEPVSLNVGDQIRIKDGATDLNTGSTYASFVYNEIFSVMQIKDNRVVFGLNGTITGATDISNCIKVSETQAQYHTVVKGDTLTGIAAQYKTTVPALINLNNINNPNMIIIGQKIRVK